MRRSITAMLAVLLMSTSALAEDWVTHTDTIEKLDVWPSGSNAWAISIVPSTEPNASCPDGFYIEQNAVNSSAAYSTLLTAFSMGLPVSIQFKVSTALNDNCKANRIRLKAS
ncbi:hypothetical protein [Microbulbifer sp. JTAC008]|uniref:hypothetical protein n=1 Tax=Microbulbifer sp. JTAC008 TaxID=3243374 RepID=UPI00403A2602